MIKLESVSKIFGNDAHRVIALNDINMSVKAGEIYGVIGTSGAGKSTLIRCVNRLEDPSSGRVWVDGVDITGLSPEQLRATRHNIAMIFQHFNLLNSRTVFENIALPLEFAGKSAKEIDETVTPLLELTGLSTKRDQYPNQLSGGQKQRVAIARALAVKPKVLLCDEATSALDPKTTQSILELLKSINSELGLTILLITHEMEVVKTICDRVAVISAGEIIEENSVRHFFVRPKTDLARDFVKNALHEKLPQEISERLSPVTRAGDHPVIRLSFMGGSQSLPVVSSISRKFDIDVSILQSSIEHIQGEPMGFLTAELLGSDDNIIAAINALREEQHVALEVLGYVD